MESMKSAVGMFVQSLWWRVSQLKRKITIFVGKIQNHQSNFQKMQKNIAEFPEFYASAYLSMKADILARLKEFTEIQEHQWFYEACYCILTPQAKAVNADWVVQQLKACDFEHAECDVLSLLRDPTHYIRFHNQKTRNLHLLKEQFEEIRSIISDNRKSPLLLRDMLTKHIRGFGMKESAHFMRNIGIFGPTILDRHILKHLSACGIHKAKTPPTSRATYLSIEKAWLRYCKKTEIPMEEMDLLFWALETGFILK